MPPLWLCWTACLPLLNLAVTCFLLGTRRRSTAEPWLQDKEPCTGAAVPARWRWRSTPCPGGSHARLEQPPPKEGHLPGPGTGYSQTSPGLSVWGVLTLRFGFHRLHSLQVGQRAEALVHNRGGPNVFLHASLLCMCPHKNPSPASPCLIDRKSVV